MYVRVFACSCVNVYGAVGLARSGVCVHARMCISVCVCVCVFVRVCVCMVPSASQDRCILVCVRVFR